MCLAQRSPHPAPAMLAPCTMTSIRVRTVPWPLWMPSVSWVVLLNPFIGSCVHTRHLICQSFEHKTGWASGVCVCVCRRHHFTFIAFLASQYQVFGNRHPSMHQCHEFMCSWVLLVLAGALVKPLKVTCLCIALFFFLTSAEISLFSSLEGQQSR